MSRFHPGWLRAHAWFGPDDAGNGRILWTPQDLPVPPTFDGPHALADDRVFLDWLEALQTHGIARLEGLPQRDGLLEEVATRIGPIRETNFGRTFALFIKDEPDSNAFTSLPLSQHMDFPTRETPPGLQFLYCRANTTTGGEGIYVDGCRVGEDMRTEDPKAFEALTSIVWDFNNRAKDCDYRASGPVIALDDNGHVTEVRLTPWLRAPLKAPLGVQEEAYTSVRALMERTEAAAYQLVFAYRAGDFVAFDNRRVLHGRRGYDAKGGTRHIEGCYVDRDDLKSRIGTLRRQMLAEEMA